MTFLDHWLLTILLLIPAVGGIVVLCLRSAPAVRFTTLGLTIGIFCLLLLVLILFHRQGGRYEYSPAGTVQMVGRIDIVPAIHWTYRVAVDGLSLPFLLITSMIGVLACVASWSDDRRRAYYAMLLWLETATLGAFLSFDLLLLWAFLTLSVLPICALIHFERGRRGAAAIVMFVAYMLPGIAFLLVATLGLRLMSTHCFAGGTLDLILLISRPCAERSLFFLMLIGFLVRLPVFPLHVWLGELTRGGSLATVLLVGLVPLTGGYGLLRVVLPLFASAAVSFSGLSVLVGIILLLYSALSSIGLEDVRMATVHLWLATGGIVLIGIATRTQVGTNGAILILLSQSLIAPCLIALTPQAAGATGSAGSPRGLIVGLAIAWMAELVMPTMLGGTMVLLGLFRPSQSGSALFSSSIDASLIGTTCLGMVLIGTGGVRILRTVSRADLSGHGETPPLLLFVAVAAALLAMLLAPFCFAYTRGALAGLNAG